MGQECDRNRNDKKQLDDPPPVGGPFVDVDCLRGLKYCLRRFSQKWTRFYELGGG